MVANASGAEAGRKPSGCGFGYRLATCRGVGPAGTVALTSGPENQGNSGFTRGVIQTNGTAFSEGADALISLIVHLRDQRKCWSFFCR